MLTSRREWLLAYTNSWIFLHYISPSSQRVVNLFSWILLHYINPSSQRVVTLFCPISSQETFCPTFGVHHLVISLATLGYTLALCWAYLGHIMATSGPWFGHITRISWPYLEDILAMCWAYLGHILSIWCAKNAKFILILMIILSVHMVHTYRNMSVFSLKIPNITLYYMLSSKISDKVDWSGL